MSTANDLPPWVLAAAQMPLAFAQVREDSLIDLQLLNRIHKDKIHGIMIASGGCTAAALAASNKLSHLHLVDINPAQIALTRLKLHLLQFATPQERTALLGHAPSANRAAALTQLLDSLHLPPTALGPPDIIANLGPDHAGRYELLFTQLRAQISDFTDQWIDVLNLPDPIARAAATAPGTPLGRALDRAFDRAMALPNLVKLFSQAATQNSALPFSRHFAARTRHAIATLPTSTNPYLWQLLTGHFPADSTYPWLTALAPKQMPEIVTSISSFDDALSQFQESFDFVHLSNILDWLIPHEATQTLQRAHNALRPGGFVWIRQLNSTLQIPTLFPTFDWLTQDAANLHAQDRSFFYRSLHVGKKP